MSCGCRYVCNHTYSLSARHRNGCAALLRAPPLSPWLSASLREEKPGRSSSRSCQRRARKPRLQAWVPEISASGVLSPEKHLEDSSFGGNQMVRARVKSSTQLGEALRKLLVKQFTQRETS